MIKIEEKEFNSYLQKSNENFKTTLTSTIGKIYKDKREKINNMSDNNKNKKTKTPISSREKPNLSPSLTSTINRGQQSSASQRTSVSPEKNSRNLVNTKENYNKKNASSIPTPTSTESSVPVTPTTSISTQSSSKTISLDKKAEHSSKEKNGQELVLQNSLENQPIRLINDVVSEALRRLPDKIEEHIIEKTNRTGEFKNLEDFQKEFTSFSRERIIRTSYTYYFRNETEKEKTKFLQESFEGFRNHFGNMKEKQVKEEIEKLEKDLNLKFSSYVSPLENSKLESQKEKLQEKNNELSQFTYKLQEMMSLMIHGPNKKDLIKNSLQEASKNEKRSTVDEKLKFISNDIFKKVLGIETDETKDNYYKSNFVSKIEENVSLTGEVNDLKKECDSLNEENNLLTEKNASLEKTISKLEIEKNMENSKKADEINSLNLRLRKEEERSKSFEDQLNKLNDELKAIRNHKKLEESEFEEVENELKNQNYFQTLEIQNQD